MTPERADLIRETWEWIRDRAVCEFVDGRFPEVHALARERLEFHWALEAKPDEPVRIEKLIFRGHLIRPLVAGRVPYLRVTCEGADVDAVPLPHLARKSPTEEAFGAYHAR